MYSVEYTNTMDRDRLHDSNGYHLNSGWNNLLGKVLGCC